MGMSLENAEEELNMKICLEKCLKVAHNHVKISSGATEVLKALVREQEMKLVILAKDLLQKYQDVIVESCKKRNVPIVFVESREEMAEIIPIKMKKSGACGIKDFVWESKEKNFILSNLQ